MKAPPILFLDVDGVLNSNSSGLEHDKCMLLKRIVDESGCKVVISSTWRTFSSGRRKLIRLAEDIGMEIISWTPDLRSRSLMSNAVRGDEIQAWLNGHPEVERFVILDDDDDMAHLKDHLVQTWFENGLTEEKANEAIYKLRHGIHP